MRYIWQVIERQTEKVPGDGRGKDTGKQVTFELPELQCGVAESFEDASRALSAWQGAEDDPPHRIYQIIPILEDEVPDGLSLEQLKIAISELDSDQLEKLLWNMADTMAETFRQSDDPAFKTTRDLLMNASTTIHNRSGN